ncbi:hypothetical protein [Aliikangiella coralliicola]|uniref:Lipoprotein n=1 Tax=Aliikangiella coralliicola TaxID=2592383 RepID=A0A545UIG6_9GAMM|nr:hypothetical protein [Aliikangiella coralliicola]TQV89261.1 hypothetical protein FLL46_03785 [Aliikangiella coralliicola]
MTRNYNYIIGVFGICGLSACSIGIQNYEVPAEHTAATIRFVAPAATASRRILSVEAFDTLQCPVNPPLTTSHKNYQGVLLHQEINDGTPIVREVQVSAQLPLTLTASLSKLLEDSSTDICYYQSHAFVPIANTHYEVIFNSACEMEVYELQPVAEPTQSVKSQGNTSTNRIPLKQNSLLETCF